MSKCYIHENGTSCQHSLREIQVRLSNRLLRKMIKLRIRDSLRETANLGYSTSLEKAQNLASNAISKFYKEVLESWASNKEEIVIAFLSKRYITIYIRQMQALILKIFALLLLVVGIVNFKNSNPIFTFLLLFFGAIFLAVAALYKSFNKDLIRHSGSSAYPNDCYWTEISTKQNFQKKKFLELDAKCFSQEEFLKNIPNYVKDAEVLETIIILHKDGFESSVKELIEVATLL